MANEIARYLLLAQGQLGSAQMSRALDLQIQQKILPKFVGNRAKLERPLWELLNYLSSGARQATSLTPIELASVDPRGALSGLGGGAQRMLETLRQVGFASFIE